MNDTSPFVIQKDEAEKVTEESDDPNDSSSDELPQNRGNPNH